MHMLNRTRNAPGLILATLHFLLIINIITTAAKLPVAQMTTDLDGPWNSNGAGELNVSCIPLLFDTIEQWIVEDGNVDSPNLYRLMLVSLGFNNPFGEFETPQAIRAGAWINIALWDAAAAYDATAVPIVDNGIERRPEAERTIANRNIAMLYAVRNLAKVVVPKGVAGTQIFFDHTGLDPDDQSTDPATPAGVGNLVAGAIILEQVKDSYNANGDREAVYNQRNFSDYTAFVPSNTAYKLTNVTKWQPLLETNGKGYFTVQHHITPQAGQAAFKLGGAAVKPQVTASSGMGRLKIPYSEPVDMDAYKSQTDYVLEVSANLTDAQKMLAEYFDAKFSSFGIMELFMSPDNATIMDSLGVGLNIVCLSNAVNLAWQQKIIYNTVRPVSAVRHLYGGQNVTAWGGQFQGTKEIDGNEWLPYLRTMPHADYPSGTACICSAFAEFMKGFQTGDPEKFPQIPSITFKRGCSKREPNFTPAEDITLPPWETWEDFIHDCGYSRLYAGVHFTPAIDSGVELCRDLGKQCYTDYSKLRKGEA